MRSPAAPLLLGAFALLAACEQAQITTPPILVAAKVPGAAVGLDVYARDRAAGSPVPRFRGQDTVPVRAYGNLNGDGIAEITGARCTVDSGLYSATLQTPANVAVPDYGPDSPAIFVRCEAQALSGSATVDAYNLTAQQRSSGAAGTGLLGAIIIGAVAAANVDPSQDEYTYPPIGVQLR